MAIVARQKGNHVVVDMPGDMRIDDIAELKNEISTVLGPDIKHLAFNLANTKLIDSSNLGLLVNLNKRLAVNGGCVHLFNPTKTALTILESASLHKVFKIFPTEHELDEHITRTQSTGDNFDYWSVAEGYSFTIRSVPLKCAVCGSTKVYGYALSPNRKRVWPAKAWLPTYEGLEGEKRKNFDRAKVAVCSECYMASISLDDFIVWKDDKEIHKHSLTPETIVLLSKGKTKRKSIMDSAGVAVGDTFFEHPRENVPVFTSYQLALECARAARSTDPFTIGYLNVVLGEYANSKDEATYFDGARAWLAKMLKTPQQYGRELRAQGHYYMLIACLRNRKKQEARVVYDQFKTFFEEIQDSLVQESVRFWFQRAREIWEKEPTQE